MATVWSSQCSVVRSLVIVGALGVFSTLSGGCKNSKPFKELAATSGEHISYIAAFVDLFDKGTAKDATDSEQLAADFARSKIAARAKLATGTPKSTTPETVTVVERLRALADECEVKAAPGAAKSDSAAKEALKTCSGGMKKLRDALDGFRAAGLKEGVKEAEMPSLDGARASKEGQKDAEPMKAALMPSKEEEALAKLWADPSATTEALDAACRAFADVHGYKSKDEKKDGADAPSPTTTTPTPTPTGKEKGDWRVSLMMLREPFLAFEYRDDPVKLAAFNRIRKPAQQCVVFSTMEHYAESGDKCAADPKGDRCQMECKYSVKSDAAQTLFANQKVYGPKSQIARIEKLEAACK